MLMIGADRPIPCHDPAGKDCPKDHRCFQNPLNFNKLCSLLGFEEEIKTCGGLCIQRNIGPPFTLY
jgi:hypothetical protein